MGNKQKAKIDEQNSKITELNSKIEALSIELENKETESKNVIQTKELEWKTLDNAKSESHKLQIEGLDSRIDVIKKELDTKQAQLDRKELKKLAEAFSEQENINELEQKKWLLALCVAAGVLIVYAVVSIFLTSEKPWDERITYYAIDIILVSAVWFCISQFSEASKLRSDYGNRKTLAQSFHNILNNLAEDQTIRTKFIEKATDVLCAPVGIYGKEPILSKKVLKDVAEIAGSFK